MRKQANRIKVTCTISEESAEFVREVAERFRLTDSAAIDVCIEQARESLEMLDQLGFKVWGKGLAALLIARERVRESLAKGELKSRRAG